MKHSQPLNTISNPRITAYGPVAMSWRLISGHVESLKSHIFLGQVRWCCTRTLRVGCVLSGLQETQTRWWFTFCFFHVPHVHKQAHSQKHSYWWLPSAATALHCWLLSPPPPHQWSESHPGGDRRNIQSGILTPAPKTQTHEMSTSIKEQNQPMLCAHVCVCVCQDIVGSVLQSHLSRRRQRTVLTFSQTITIKLLEGRHRQSCVSRVSSPWRACWWKCVG